MRRIATSAMMLVSMLYGTAQSALTIDLLAEESNGVIKVHLTALDDVSLLSMQGTLDFNASLCDFFEVIPSPSFPSISPLTGISSVGEVGFSWLVDNGAAIPISSGDTLCSFLFGTLSSEASDVTFALTSGQLSIEFVGAGFNIFEVSGTSTSISWDYATGNSSTVNLGFTASHTDFSNVVQIDLVALEPHEILSCQGSILIESPSALISNLNSGILSDLDIQNSFIDGNVIGWSWFVPDVQPILLDSGSVLLSVSAQITPISDSITLGLQSSPIAIEFIDGNFDPIELLPFTVTVPVSSDSGFEDCTDCVQGCTYNLACNFNPAASIDNGTCLFPELGYDCNGDCTFDIDNDGICDFSESYGCTYSNATNFDPSATEDNGICLFETGTTCPSDVDGDGVTGVADLLEILSLFGLICY